MVGYCGRVLRVDLSAERCYEEPLREEWARLYIGGKGLGLRYLLDLLPVGTPADSAANPLLFVTGPLSGTLVSSISKLTVISKSPATGTLLDSSMGGSCAARLKFAGYDVVTIEGRASRPVYLDVTADGAEIRGASELWGKGCHETELILRRWFGRANPSSVGVISIGPAGENHVPFACLTSDFFRQAGRGGAGAVMGAKNLKAIVIRGERDLPVADMAALLEFAAFDRRNVLADGYWACEEGTPQLVDQCQLVGILPTHNFTRGRFAGCDRINLEALRPYRRRVKACYGCPVGCGHLTQIGRTVVEGPEYETLALVGSNCEISDLEAVAEFNRMCDDLGLDTISTGNVVGLAMHLAELGVHDFGLRFGDVCGFLEVVPLIARRQGVGADLAEGSAKLAAHYGVPELAVHVKGLELPGYEPRGSWGMGLSYAVADRGGCHMRAFTVGEEALGGLDPFTGKDKAAVTIALQNRNAVKYSTGACSFRYFPEEVIAEAVKLVTGLEMSVDELKLAGERIYNLGRIFNVREGFRRDTLPARLLEEPLGGEGPAAGRVIPREVFEEMLSEYYRLRGWDDRGIPTVETAQRVGLDGEVIAQLETVLEAERGEKTLGE